MSSSKRNVSKTLKNRIVRSDGHEGVLKKGEMAKCGSCEAVYAKGRWTLDPSVLTQDPFHRKEILSTECPACLQKRDGEPSGFVYISGTFYQEHSEEIQNLISNEEKKIASGNPLARVIEHKKEKDGIVVATTTEHLAQHLGRILNNAYGGDVRYDFSRGNKLARVYWNRD